MNKETEYINPIDKIIDNLKAERDRRIDAYSSGRFCDEEVLLDNIMILDKGIKAMEKEIERWG